MDSRLRGNDCPYSRHFHHDAHWAPRIRGGFRIVWFVPGQPEIRIILLAPPQDPAPLEEPQGWSAGPALPQPLACGIPPFQLVIEGKAHGHEYSDRGPPLDLDGPYLRLTQNRND
jgi:hypothetical protein